MKNLPTILTSMSERYFCSVDSRVPRKIFNGLFVFGFLISLSSKSRHLSARVGPFHDQLIFLLIDDFFCNEIIQYIFRLEIFHERHVIIDDIVPDVFVLDFVVAAFKRKTVLQLTRDI